MTSPITPLPALHVDPTAVESFEHQVQAEVQALQQMFSNILPGIIKEIVKALVPGAEGIVDELTTWEQNLLSGDWMRQIGSALTNMAEPGIKDIENWANSLRTLGQNIHLSDIIDLPDLFTLPISHVGKPVTSPNLLTNADFSEAVPEQGPWTWNGPQLFCFSVGGTGEPTGTGNTAQVGSALNPSYWNWTPVAYSAALYPMQNSINDGINKLVAAIQTVPVGTKIALIGVSQGAVVTSKVWETEFVSTSGTLHNRLNDVVAAVTFGNPRRAAGSHAAGTPDPGGHGIATNDLQTNVPSWWYDYSNPDDVVPIVPNGAGGVYAGQLYDFLTNTWNGDSDTLLSTILSTFTNPAGTVSSTVELLEMIAGDAWKTLTGHNPHTSYNTVKIDGTNTSVQLAVSYLDSVGAANVGVSGTNFQTHSGGSGSVTVYANGTVEEWLHPDVITVTPEQTINVSAWTRVSGLTATGSPIIVGLTTFLNGAVVSKVDLGSIAGSTSWTQVVGTAYTVPSGVDSVKLRLKVDSTATAGQVWFDDLSLTKTGLLPTSHVFGLNDLITNLFGSLNIGTVLQPPSIPDITAAMSSDLQGLMNEVSNGFAGLVSGATRTLTDVSNTIQDFFQKALIDAVGNARLPVLPAAHVGSVNPELLTNGSFDTSQSIDSTGAYTWDGTTDHTGKSGSGSAKVTANGTLLSLNSNEIPVAQGHSLNLGGYVQWSGVAGTGSTFQLNAVAYLNGSVVNTTTIAQVTNPAASSTWTNLSGTYTTPSGVDVIRVQIAVTAAATAGTVWWDDLTATKSGLIPQDFVTNLVSDLQTQANNLSNLINQLLTDPAAAIGSLVSNVIDGIGSTFQQLLDGLHNGFSGSSGTGHSATDVSSSATSLASTANTANTNATNISTNMYNGWYTSGGTGDSSQVTTVMGGIKTTIQGGYTVQTLTASGTFNVPSGNILDFWAICIGGGGGGGHDPTGGTNVAGGQGGVNGGYCAQQINPSALGAAGTAITYTIGAGAAGGSNSQSTPGNATTFGSFATSATTTPTIASLFGYYDANSSAPGDGGQGGTSGGHAGAAGGSTPLASGGAGGVGSTPGGAGGTASTTGQTHAGGGGGGGGSGVSGAGGSAGGAGGFPGGGGGGGGVGTTSGGGAGGTGANGCIVLLYRIQS